MSDELLAMFESLDNDDSVVREGYVRSMMNYTGCKDGSLPKLLPLLPYTDKWIDVFGGSGAVTAARRPVKLEVYNDRHSGLTAFYRALIHRPDELYDTIKLMVHSRELFAFSKETFEQDQDDVIRGAKWYFMVQSSFAGRGQYFGRVTKGRSNIWKKIQGNLDHFDALYDRFLKVQIENLSWQEIFKDYDDYDAVFYCDPPYVESNVYQHIMSKKDHILMCERIFDLKGFVALSGFENEIYNRFPWDSVHSWPVSNHVKTMAFTDRNNMTDRHTIIDRTEARDEFLYIKEASV